MLRNPRNICKVNRETGERMVLFDFVFVINIVYEANKKVFQYEILKTYNGIKRNLYYLIYFYSRVSFRVCN